MDLGPLYGSRAAVESWADQARSAWNQNQKLYSRRNVSLYQWSPVMARP